jgi:hypothetical protein
MDGMSIANANLFSCGRAIRSKAGGARRNRTDDLLLAKQALSQLSYGPLCSGELKSERFGRLAEPKLAAAFASRAKAGGPGKI